MLINNKLCIVVVLVILQFIAGPKAIAQLHWESMVAEYDTWKYLAATAEPPTNWYQPSFVDTNWKSGIGGLGYGDGDDATVVSSCGSLYLRYKVNVTDVTLIKDLILDIDYDDAFILYINGVECARSANVSGTYPSFNTLLSTDHEANIYSGGNAERFQLQPSMLVNGQNTFAVQVLNQGLYSSDLSARVYVQARIISTSTVYHPTPSWFTVPVNNSVSNLPLIFINTNGQNIVANSKIMVDLKTLNSATGINAITDTTYEYNGMAGVEIRGFTSANFPKKSFTVETRYPNASNLNTELLGLPKENDWVFNGPYPDKSLMRNVLAYHLGNKTGRWSPWTKYFELYLNGNYNGVYVLIEKIKNDKNRLNLAEITAIDTIGDEITGGYILKLDRPEATDVEGVDYWVSPYRAATALQQKEYFLHVDPEGDKLLPVQRNYIKNYITDFENVLYSNSYTHPTQGYYPYVNLQSFVDYYIITELSRNLDGYRISTFLHKDKDSKGGKLTMGPFWDYDICFGNANFFSAGNTAGWVIDGMGDGDAYAMPFWWKKFRLDPQFNSLLKQRWNTLTNDFLNTNHINQFIDSCATVLAEAQVRNFTKWNILNTYVWPNNYVGGSFANEVTYLKNWVRDRISWMNAQIQTITSIENTSINSFELITYPNPFTNQLNFKYYLEKSGTLDIRINNALGQQIYRKAIESVPGFHDLPIELKTGESGIYFYTVILNGQVLNSGKLIRK